MSEKERLVETFNFNDAKLLADLFSTIPLEDAVGIVAEVAAEKNQQVISDVTQILPAGFALIAIRVGLELHRLALERVGEALGDTIIPKEIADAVVLEIIEKSKKMLRLVKVDVRTGEASCVDADDIELDG